jgi:hypothetical protein
VFCRTRHSRLPLWLLIAAWICANTPHVAILTIAAWLAQAQTFSHQQRLSLEVACLLTGQPQPAGTFASARHRAASLPAPVIATDAFSKRFDLAVEIARPDFGPTLSREAFPAMRFPVPEPVSFRPPHEPPRTDARLS